MAKTKVAAFLRDDDIPSENPKTVDAGVAKKIDVDRAFGLYTKHHNFHEVARIMGCTAQGVQQRLRRYQGFIESYSTVEQFRENRADVLTAAESRLLRSVVDDEAVQKAPLAARAMAFGILNERRRLEEGKSTQNLLHGAIVKIQRAALELTLKNPAKTDDDGQDSYQPPATGENGTM